MKLLTYIHRFHIANKTSCLPPKYFASVNFFYDDCFFQGKIKNQDAEIKWRQSAGAQLNL